MTQNHAVKQCDNFFKSAGTTNLRNQPTKKRMKNVYNIGDEHI